MEQSMSEKGSSQQFQQMAELVGDLPQREQWALINQQRAWEYQRAKSLEKELQRQKKETFKKELDEQMQKKHSLQKDEKAEDRKYYDYIVSRAQEMKQKEEKDRLDRFLRSKQMQEDNHRNIHKQPLTLSQHIHSSLDIGRKSEEEKKQRAEIIRRDVILTLDRQREEKEAMRRRQKEQELESLERNRQYQSELEQRRGSDKKYGQNVGVYNYYRDLYRQKAQKDQELEHKLVDEAKERQSQDYLRRRQSELTLREKKNYQMRDTLQKQLELIHQRKRSEGKVNPEQASYSFIGSVFKDKRPTFDKEAYSRFLEKQVQQQKANRLRQEKYMSEEEYRYNANQLNKALHGTFAHDHYLDRSIANVGDRLNLTQVEPLPFSDNQLVSSKLEEARRQGTRSRVRESEMQLLP